MTHEYQTKGVCTKSIMVELDNDIVKSVKFNGGCPGNLLAISKVVEGMSVAQIKEKFTGIRCGAKETSCADQLVKAIENAQATQTTATIS